MYYVDTTEETRREIRRLFRLACAEGRGQAFLTALKGIQSRLEQDPNEFGEPLYIMKLWRLTISTAAIRPLTVVYGVSEDHPFVILRNVRLMGLA
jgi:hypothetical protein